LICVQLKNSAGGKIWHVIGYSHLRPSHKTDAIERIAQHSPTVFTTPAKEPEKKEAARAA
jgi:hypothetical protein